MINKLSVKTLTFQLNIFRRKYTEKNVRIFVNKCLTNMKKNCLHVQVLYAIKVQSNSK